jgi:hypothetical protein
MIVFKDVQKEKRFSRKIRNASLGRQLLCNPVVSGFLQGVRDNCGDKM